jgi:hypothetical protein
MNRPRNDKILKKYFGPALPDALVPATGSIIPEDNLSSNDPSFQITLPKTNAKRDPNIVKDSLFTLKRSDVFHIISENYAYKTETYYSILHHELKGEPVQPTSRAILDAYVVPLSLERAKLAGIPVCTWGISQGYIPLPAILYGLNYFATPSDYFVVRDMDQAKEIIKHLTNKGKYPFCYQKLTDDATIHSCVGIFGKTTSPGPSIPLLVQKVYEQFLIPLVTMIFVKTADSYLLSSLSPTKYSHLSAEERTILNAYLSGQEFL